MGSGLFLAQPDGFYRTKEGLPCLPGRFPISWFTGSMNLLAFLISEMMAAMTTAVLQSIQLQLWKYLEAYLHSLCSIAFLGFSV